MHYVAMPNIKCPYCYKAPKRKTVEEHFATCVEYQKGVAEYGPPESWNRPCACKCGKLAPWRKTYIKTHNQVDTEVRDARAAWNRLCLCGCGQVTNYEHDWLRGHSSRGGTPDMNAKVALAHQKQANALRGRTKETHEGVRIRAEKVSGRTLDSGHPSSVARSLKMKGVPKPDGFGAKLSKALKGMRRTPAQVQAVRDAYANGTRSVSPKSGRGIRSQVQTPLQGLKMVRSSTEKRRAEDLNAQGVVWYYEAIRYRLTDGRSYLPDFWIFPTLSLDNAPKNPSPTEVADLMITYPCVVEDVKGWYGEKHASFSKVEAFKASYPQLDFRLVIL